MGVFFRHNIPKKHIFKNEKKDVQIMDNKKYGDLFMEVFDFEADVYRSALIPASMDRVEKQLEAISPYVDVVLCYQYLGMFNEPSTIAYCGHPDSVRYFEEYQKFRKKHEIVEKTLKN